MGAATVPPNTSPIEYGFPGEPTHTAVTTWRV